MQYCVEKMECLRLVEGLMSLAGLIEEEVFTVLNDLQLEPASFHMTQRLKQPAVFSACGQSTAFPPHPVSIPSASVSAHTLPFSC